MPRIKSNKDQYVPSNSVYRDKKSRNQRLKKTLLAYPLRKSMSNINDQSNEDFKQTLYLNNSRKFSAHETPEIHYIKNLEKQIYFLELETSFLRGQSKKGIIDIPSKFSKESEDMNKVQKLQENHEIIIMELNDIIFELKNEKELLLENIKQIKETYNEEKKKRDVIELKTKNKFEIIESNLKTNQISYLTMKNEFLEQIEIINNQKQKLESRLNLKCSTIKKLEHNITVNEEKITELEKNIILMSTLKDEFQNKELSTKSESINLRQKAKQYELLLKAEKCLNEKHIETNDALILENSELYQKLNDQQSDFDQEVIKITNNDEFKDKLQNNIENMKDIEKDLRNQLSINSTKLIDIENKYKQRELKIKKQEDIIDEQRDTIKILQLKMNKKCEDWKEFDQLAKRMNFLSNSLNL